MFFNSLSLFDALDVSNLYEHDINISHHMHLSKDIGPSIDVDSRFDYIKSVFDVEIVTKQLMLR